MSTTVGLVLLGIVALVVVAVILLRPRKGAAAPTAEEPTIDSAWNRFTADPSTWAPREVSTGRATDLDQLKASLGEAAERVAGAPEPRAALRQAIMDASDRFIQVETLAAAHPPGGTSDPASLADYVSSVVEAGVLRCYAGQRYEDFARDDWYAHYLKTAEMSARNIAGIVRKTVRGEAASIEGSLHDPLMDAMREVRAALLHHPPRTPVRRADKLTHKTEPTKPYPSQEQIDRLVAVMNERFEKLFSGMVYQLDDGSAVDPAGAFQVDAALLYTLLAVHFRHPVEGWRQVMDKSLGAYRSAMQNEERMLEIGRACHSAWSGNVQGPLPVVMQTSCRLAFGDSAAADSESAKSMAAAMMEDAQILVGAICEVVDKPGPGWNR